LAVSEVVESALVVVMESALVLVSVLAVVESALVLAVVAVVAEGLEDILRWLHTIHQVSKNMDKLLLIPPVHRLV
jgi:hypothetical protein